MTEELAKKMNGKYKLEKSEKFEEYLNARGANFMMRKMATGMSPYMEVNLDGDILSMKIYVAIKTLQDVKCKLGEEVDAGERPDGTRYKIKYWVEEGKLQCTQTDAKGVEHVSREMVDGDTCIMTMKFNDVECKRYFKRCQ